MVKDGSKFGWDKNRRPETHMYLAGKESPTVSPTSLKTGPLFDHTPGEMLIPTVTQQGLMSLLIVLFGR